MVQCHLAYSHLEDCHLVEHLLVDHHLVKGHLAEAKLAIAGTCSTVKKARVPQGCLRENFYVLFMLNIGK